MGLLLPGFDAWLRSGSFAGGPAEGTQAAGDSSPAAAAAAGDSHLAEDSPVDSPAAGCTPVDSPAGTHRKPSTAMPALRLFYFRTAAVVQCNASALF